MHLERIEKVSILQKYSTLLSAILKDKSQTLKIYLFNHELYA